MKCFLHLTLKRDLLSVVWISSGKEFQSLCAICCQLLRNIPRGIKMVSVCTGLLGEEGHVSTSVDTEYLNLKYLIRIIIYPYD